MKKQTLKPREVEQEQNEVDEAIAQGKARKPKTVKRMVKRNNFTAVKR